MISSPHTNGFNGFSMVLGSFNHWFQWFSRVMDHLSNDTMVSMYHSPLSEILTLAVFRGQLRHFLNGVVIFFRIPSCLSWPRKTAKVTCIFFKEFWVFWVNNFETSKYYSGGPKNPEIVQKLFIFDFPFWREHVFLPQKGPYLPNRPNRKRAWDWDAGTRRVCVYREQFNIDFWPQFLFLTSQHV